VAAQHEVFVLASEAVELSPGIAVLAAEISPGIAVLAVEPEVVFVAVASVAVVSLAGVAEPQASVDIHVVFVVLVPVSAAVVEVDSSERPTFVAFPNVDCCATSASSVEVVGDQSVRNAKDAHTSYDLCSILSTLGLHHNKNLEHSCNNPSPGYNTVSDTNDLAMDGHHQPFQKNKSTPISGTTYTSGVSGSTITAGGSANTTGGGKPILTLIPTCAMVGMGTTITSAKSIVTKSNFFILLPPLSVTGYILYELARLDT
jgi:hypothetical protein